LKIDRSLGHLDRSTAVIERGIPVQQAKSRIESFFVSDTQTLCYCHPRLMLQTNQSNKKPQPKGLLQTNQSNKKPQPKGPLFDKHPHTRVVLRATYAHSARCCAGPPLYSFPRRAPAARSMLHWMVCKQPRVRKLGRASRLETRCW
jgi:hypothetical protein